MVVDRLHTSKNLVLGNSQNTIKKSKCQRKTNSDYRKPENLSMKGNSRVPVTTGLLAPWMTFGFWVGCIFSNRAYIQTQKFFQLHRVLSQVKNSNFYGFIMVINFDFSCIKSDVFIAEPPAAVAWCIFCAVFFSLFLSNFCIINPRLF